ncbi:muscle M-line assembly unc-89-like [Olea europaea subsp. europaea]|uniref:Muscle M-line assembly unc-89-like n=1 Tax=Olea europaea subsp. europaea TaxID=158383 RepID=A0A8S0TY67_OLEEU|nr:muscle M-line assembly unc-89-like [Olea europaea subsp. europaea]
MGSPSHRDASQKELEDGLVEAGNKLLKLPSFIDELLILLEKAENLLPKVRQQPPKSTAKALLPLMTALVTDELSQHTDVNVKVSVAFCINELTRISAPDSPYSDDHMKGIFGLFMVAFEKLSCESGRNYERALQILETMANIRSCLMMVDIECDALIGEMFQLFLKTIRSNHPPSVFSHMETIMTLVIQESDEISFQLLSPLLASATMNNKNVSPISWELGEQVFRNCATKLKLYLRKAVETINLDIDEYAEIVTSICRDTSSRTNKVAKETVMSDEEISNSDPEDSTPETKIVNGNLSDGESSQGTLRSCQQDHKNADLTEIQQQETDTAVVRKRRDRKPNSLIKQEEGYDHAWMSEGKDFYEVPHNGKNQEKSSSPRSSSSKELTSSTEPRKDKMLDAFCKKRSHSEKISTYVSEDHTANDGPSRRRGRPKKKESITVKNGGILCDIDTDGKDELSLLGFDGSKIMRNAIISGKCKSEKVGDKMVVSPPTSGPAKAKCKMNSAPDKEKKSGRTRIVKNYGAELVGEKIQVWWPMDKTFYPGIVNSFDPLTKKHKIIYEDEVEENLNLSKERWELVAKCPQLKKEAEFPSSATMPVKNKRKKIEKRKAGSSTERELGTSSSKRLFCF